MKVRIALLTLLVFIIVAIGAIALSQPTTVEASDPPYSIFLPRLDQYTCKGEACMDDPIIDCGCYWEMTLKGWVCKPIDICEE